MVHINTLQDHARVVRGHRPPQQGSAKKQTLLERLLDMAAKTDGNVVRIGNWDEFLKAKRALMKKGGHYTPLPQKGGTLHQIKLDNPQGLGVLTFECTR